MSLVAGIHGIDMLRRIKMKPLEAEPHQCQKNIFSIYLLSSYLADFFAIMIG